MVRPLVELIVSSSGNCLYSGEVVDLRTDPITGWFADHVFEDETDPPAPVVPYNTTPVPVIVPV
jgi:hypothetical protein